MTSQEEKRTGLTGELTGRLRQEAHDIDNRLGPISGCVADRLAVMCRDAADEIARLKENLAEAINTRALEYDLNKFDAVVHHLGIEDSDIDPVDAIKVIENRASAATIEAADLRYRLAAQRARIVDLERERDAALSQSRMKV